jgi:AcrR family transcriptional regulator
MKAFRRRGYHHGNLREALLAAAQRLIAERGPAGFTLIEAARLAKVSAAAPYRHFADREALLAEVARRGFAEFDRRLAAAWKGAARDPGAAFRRMGEAYLKFARDEPGYYAAMFAAGSPAPRRRASPPKHTFGALQAAITQIAAPAGEGVDARSLACQVWALSHGLATLSSAGLLPSRAARLKPAALLRDGVGALIRGAGGKKPSAKKAAGPPPPRRGGAKAPRPGSKGAPKAGG